MTVQSLDDLAQARIQECATRAVAEFKSSVRPIYGLQDGRLTHIGSCLLLVIDGRYVLSTAAHVADNLIYSPLFVAGPAGTHPVQLQGKFRGTTAPAGDRRQDHFDCAYGVLSKEDAAALGAVEFLGDSKISHNRAPAEGRERTAKRISDALGTATELRSQKNYAGHRLSPWLGHVMVSRQESARALLTLGEVMQLPPQQEVVMVSGYAPVRAQKLRYFEDQNFKSRVVPPPILNSAAYADRPKARTDDWPQLPEPVPAAAPLEIRLSSVRLPGVVPCKFAPNRAIISTQFIASERSVTPVRGAKSEGCA
jgi:hypothetical protein